MSSKVTSNIRDDYLKLFKLQKTVRINSAVDKTKQSGMNNRADKYPIKQNSGNKPISDLSRKAQTKISEMFKNDTKIKKSLKGRLHNLLNKNIVVNLDLIDKEYLSHLKSNKVEKPNSQKFLPLYDKNLVNIYTNKTVNFDNNNLYLNRYMDHLLTPDELIFQNFKEKEIKIIASDPFFFNLNDKLFQSVTFFKNKNLIDLIKEEDTQNKPSMMRRMRSSLLSSRVAVNKMYKRDDSQTSISLSKSKPSSISLHEVNKKLAIRLTKIKINLDD